MHSSQRFFNEKLPTRTEYLFRLLLAVLIIFAVPLLGPFLKPRVFSGSGIDWFIAAVIAIVFVSLSFFEKIFVSIHFDYEKKEVSITSRTILDGDITQTIPFSNFAYRQGQEGSLRKTPTKVLELLKGRRRVIKLEAKAIGEYTFNEIAKALNTLKP